MLTGSPMMQEPGPTVPRREDLTRTRSMPWGSSVVMRYDVMPPGQSVVTPFELRPAPLRQIDATSLNLAARGTFHFIEVVFSANGGSLITAILVRRTRQDRRRAAHTIRPDDNARRDRARSPCCHMEFAKASPSPSEALKLAGGRRKPASAVALRGRFGGAFFDFRPLVRLLHQDSSRRPLMPRRNAPPPRRMSRRAHFRCLVEELAVNSA